MDYKKDRGKDVDKEDTINAKEIESRSIPVIEESVDIHKERIETGKVSVRKIVREEEQNVDIPLTYEQVEVESIIINKYVDSPPKVRQEGDTTIIPILKEVIEKRLVLVEEVRVTRRTLQTHSSENIKLRKEDVVVERERIDPEVGKE
jgi:uncharacterized protein (TIGR02271 family)